MNKIILIGILLLIPFLLLSQEKPDISDINPAFTDYLNKKEAGQWNNVTEDGYGLGLIPLPVIPQFITPVSGSAKEHPVSYDLRDYDLVSSVKNQGSCGSCWSFATMAAIESHWLVKSYGNQDFSEQNLMTCHGFVWGPCEGGNLLLSGAYLSRMDGPISETDDPYNDSENAECDDSFSSYTYIPQAKFLPPDPDVLKQIIMDHGGLYTSFYWDDAYYNSSDYTYYYNGTPASNHAVLLVGWDDNKVTAATENGAWIIKNSWGADWGENGYFYISYSDASILTSNAYFPAKTEFNPDNELYMYDELGWVSSCGFSIVTSYGLSKYVASCHQEITKVGTWVNAEGTKVEFEIYDTKNNNTLSGLLGSLPEQTCDYPGYHTFDLASPVLITKDNDFYVKVKYTVPVSAETPYPIPIEMAWAGFASPDIEKNVCWISSNGSSWQNIGSNGPYKWDLCIRAFANKKPLVWTGSSDSDWSNANNWSPQFLPASGDDVIIPSGLDNYPEINSGSNPVIRHMDVKPGAHFLIPSGKSITVQGDLSVRSGASGTASYIDNGTLTVEGKATVERYLAMQEWHYISSPISNATGNMITGEGQNFYYYDETSQQWGSVGSTDPLTVMKGYNVFLPWNNTVEKFSGNINTGNKSIEVTAGGSGWNLVGNPYPSAIDWDATEGWTKTNVNNAIYIWNQGIENWATYVLGASANGGSQYIAQGQGFWIQATGTGTLGTTNEVRLINHQPFLKSKEWPDNTLRLKVSGNSYSDETIIRFNPDATENFNGEYDAIKKFSHTYVPQIYSITACSVEVSINTLPSSTGDIIIPLFFNIDNSGSFTITTEGILSFNETQVILLQDLKEGQFIDLTNTSAYTFSFVSGDDPGRFLIHFTTVITDDNNIPSQTENDIDIFSFSNTIYIKGKDQKTINGRIHVYDLLGKEVISVNAILAPLFELPVYRPDGYYIVRVITKDQVYTEKVFISSK